MDIADKVTNPVGEPDGSAPVEAGDEHETHYKASLPKLRELGFANVLKMFEAGVRDSKAQVRFLAETALVLFANTGDLGQLRALLAKMDGVGKDYIRRAAFLTWLFAHAPLALVNRTISKDHVLADKMQWNINEAAKAALVEKALSMPFWTFAPEKQDIQFTADDIIKALYATLRKFEGAKYHGDDDAKERLTLAKSKVVELERIRKQRAADPAPAEPIAAQA